MEKNTNNSEIAYRSPAIESLEIMLEKAILLGSGEAGGNEDGSDDGEIG